MYIFNEVMYMSEMITQSIGIVAMLFNIFSYQQKTAKGIFYFQLLGCFLFSVNFFLLGSISGALFCLVGAIRSVVFLNKSRLHSDHIGWLIGFILIYICIYVLTFTLFGKEFTLINALVELLPTTAMTAITIAFRMQNAKVFRLIGLIHSPCWLIYDIVVFSLGGIIGEILALCSIFIGILRLDRRKKAPEKEE